MTRTFPAEDPAAQMRRFAKSLRGVHIDLRREGFSDKDALIFIGQWLAALQPGVVEVRSGTGTTADRKAAPEEETA